MFVENRTLFRFNRLILLNLPILFRWLSFSRSYKKRLLVIKVDEIGDYVLVRNFIEILKGSDKYRDFEIELLGNNVWKDLTETYDSQWLTDFIFVNPENLYSSPIKTWRIAWKLFKKDYQAVLQPTSSRSFICDVLAGFTAAPQIIGFESDTERIYKKYKKKTDKFYTEKLLLPKDIHFEFERNRYFFEQIINTKVLLPKPTLPTNSERKNIITIFPGAGSVKRQWGKENFVSLIELILNNTTCLVHLGGGKSEMDYGNFIVSKLLSDRIINSIGQTTLTELVELIASSKCVITNETSAVHLAAACEIPTICILGGGHYERFSPYPSSISSGLFFIYEKWSCFNCNWNCIYGTEKKEPYPCVAINSVQKVWDAFNTIIA